MCQLNKTKRENIVMIILLITLHMVTAKVLFFAVEDVEKGGGSFSIFTRIGEERFQFYTKSMEIEFIVI